MPVTTVEIHGKRNLQNLEVGKDHNALRKIFSSLFSPRSLDSFLPHMIAHFDTMWKMMEDQKKDGSNGEVQSHHIRTVIRDTQLKLMCFIVWNEV